MKKELSHQIAIAIMKVSMIPVLVALFALNSFAKNVTGQETLLDKKVTLKVKDEEIRKVFSELEKMTTAKFVYSPEVITAYRKVTVEAKNKELAKVLNGLLEPLNISYEVVNNYIILRREQQVEFQNR